MTGRGEPLPDAIGQFGKDFHHPVASIRTDEAGRFSLRVPEAGRYEANVYDPGPRLPRDRDEGFAGPGVCDVPPEGTSSCVMELQASH